MTTADAGADRAKAPRDRAIPCGTLPLLSQRHGISPGGVPVQKLDLHVVTTPDHDTSFALFADQQADAFASDDILLYGFIAQKADAELTVVGDMLSYDPYGIMYRKDDPGMAQVVERAFTHLAETGAIVRLYNKWLLEPLPGGERLNRPMTPQLEEAFHSLGWPE